MEDGLIRRAAAEYVAATFEMFRQTNYLYKPGDASAVVVAWKKSTLGMFMAYQHGMRLGDPTSVSFQLYSAWARSQMTAMQFIETFFAQVLAHLSA